MDLVGKTALITGSAHRIGKAIALKLAKKGSNIIIHYGNSSSEAKKTVEQIMDLGVDAIHLQADLSNLDSINQLFEQVIQNFSDIDIVVNNAASFVKKEFDDVDIHDWNKSMNINLRAPFFITQKFSQVMNSEELNYSRLIVNIADLSGIYPWSSFSTHGISKAGLIHLTKIAAKELAPHIRVNAIAPGPILPPAGMTEDSKRWKEMMNNLPLKHSGSPEDIGETVIYLAENDFITGTIIPVDGGENLVGSINH